MNCVWCVDSYVKELIRALAPLPSVMILIPLQGTLGKSSSIVTEQNNVISKKRKLIQYDCFKEVSGVSRTYVLLGEDCGDD